MYFYPAKTHYLYNNYDNIRKIWRILFKMYLFSMSGKQTYCYLQPVFQLNVGVSTICFFYGCGVSVMFFH